MYKTIRKWIRFTLDLVFFTVGLVLYKVTNQTSRRAQLSMIRLFCASKGYSNDMVSWLLRLMNRPYRFNNVTGVLGRLTQDQINLIANKIKSEGYYVFEQKISESVCKRILEFAESKEAILEPLDDAVREGRRLERYNREDIKAIRYSLQLKDIIENEDIQDLLSDLSLISIAQEYLDCKPRMDVAALWWSTAFSKKPGKNAAQYYHFDLDRLKWIKFFFYITDVTPQQGPHSFVKGSHLKNGIPNELLRQGYSRLEDSEVSKHYPKESIKQFSGLAGTIIAEDTRGLHKGVHVEKGERLVLQLQFCNSFFGSSLERARFTSIKSDKLRAALKQYRNIYSYYL